MVPSFLRFCVWTLLLPLPPCLLFCAATFRVRLLSVGLLCRLRLLCLLASTSDIPATSTLSLVLCGFASGLSHSSRLLACFFSALFWKTRLCCRSVCYVGYVSSAFDASTSVIPPSPPWSRLLCGSASALSDSLCFLACVFSALRCKALLCCREVSYVGYACCASTQVRLLFRLRLVCHFFSAVLRLVSCTPLASLSASFAALLCKVHLCCRITLLCRLRLLCLLPKYVCNSGHVSSVPSPCFCA